MAQNVRIHEGAKISRLAWTRKAIEMKKLFSSPVIETDSSAIVNNFIKNGIIINHEIKTCKLLCRESRLIQCFNCQKYGYIGRACKSTTRCKHCAAGHSSASCTTKETKKCAACNQEGHEAWFFKCSERMLQEQKTIFAFASRPLFHVIEEDEADIAGIPVGGQETENRGRKRGRRSQSSTSPERHSSWRSTQMVRVESSALEMMNED